MRGESMLIWEDEKRHAARDLELVIDEIFVNKSHKRQLNCVYKWCYMNIINGNILMLVA